MLHTLSHRKNQTSVIYWPDRKKVLDVLCLVNLWFWGRSECKDDRPGLWYADLFRFLLRNCLIESGKTWQEATKMTALVSDWLRHFRPILCNRWTEIAKKMTGSKYSTSSTKLHFRAHRKTKTGFLFSTSLQPLNGIRWNFTGSKYATSST